MSDGWGRARLCAACKFQRVIGNRRGREHVAGVQHAPKRKLATLSLRNWQYEGMGPPSGSPFAFSTGGSSGAVGMYILIARGSGEGRRSSQSAGMLESARAEQAHFAIDTTFGQGKLSTAS